jgi:hypothetical protein
MARHKKRRKETFDDHMALSYEEACGVLKFFSIPEREFNEWIDGQTCPVIPSGNGIACGYYLDDVSRFVKWKVKGVTPIFD